MSEIYPFKRYSRLSGLRNAHKNNNMVIICKFLGFFGGICGNFRFYLKSNIVMDHRQNFDPDFQKKCLPVNNKE